MLCGSFGAGDEDTGVRYMTPLGRGDEDTRVCYVAVSGPGCQGYGCYCEVVLQRWLVMIRGRVMWQFGGVGDEDTGASYAAVSGRGWLCGRMKRRATPVYARPLALRGGVAPRGELSFDLIYTEGALGKIQISNAPPRKKLQLCTTACSYRESISVPLRRAWGGGASPVCADAKPRHATSA